MKSKMKHQKRPKRVAICVDIAWPIRRELEIFAGCQRYANQMGWKCSVEPAIEQQLVAGGAQVPYDGIVGRITPRIADAARAAGVPLVNVWLNSPVKDSPSVFVDYAESGRLAARHLLGSGFRRFGYLGIRGYTDARLQLSGFREALLAEGRSCNVFRYPPRYANRNSPYWSAFIEGLRVWIGEQKPPFGILASEDLCCRFLIDICHEMGIKVSKDVAIIGTGNETVICTATSQVSLALISIMRKGASPLPNCSNA